MTKPGARARHAIDVEVVLDSPGWSRRVRGARAWCTRAARAAASAAAPAKRRYALCIALSSDRRVKALNRVFRGIDKPTNVLSFAAELPAGQVLKGPAHLGDIVIALETASREAKMERKTLRAHVAHLVVHGTLHLLGRDHETDRDAAAMEALERRVLAGLGVADPYAEPTPRAAARRRRTTP